MRQARAGRCLCRYRQEILVENQGGWRFGVALGDTRRSWPLVGEGRGISRKGSHSCSARNTGPRGLPSLLSIGRGPRGEPSSSCLPPHLRIARSSSGVVVLSRGDRLLPVGSSRATRAGQSCARCRIGRQAAIGRKRTEATAASRLVRSPAANRRNCPTNLPGVQANVFSRRAHRSACNALGRPRPNVFKVELNFQPASGVPQSGRSRAFRKSNNLPVMTAE